VYVVGAGINKVLKIHSKWARSIKLSPENYEDINPPLIDDFFQVALKMEEYGYIKSEYDILYEYINENWGKSKVGLKTEKLSLEDCVTSIEIELNQAIKNDDAGKIKKIGKVRFTLISLFINILNSFEKQRSIESSEEMSYFGKYIYKNHPTIITFNYDYFIERSIEIASDFKVDSQSIEILWGWKRALSYGIKFDEIETFNLSTGDCLVKGEEFYMGKSLYPWSILKLHGSLNWFQYLPLHDHPDFADGPKCSLPKGLLKRTILRFDSQDPTIMGNFDINGRYVSPIIITPEIHKNTGYEKYAYILDCLWEKAKKIAF